MISYVRGQLAEKTINSCVVETNGIGLEVQVPQTVLTALPPVGEEICIFTYLKWSDDGPALYGFSDHEERDIFRLLINVSGVGPKGALGVLSALSTDELRFAVLSEDVKKISKAPGIGPKTARRIILELKDKLKIRTSEDAGLVSSVQGDDPDQSKDATARNDALEAMAALGFGAAESYKAVQSLGDLSGMDSEAILKAAMKKLV